MAIPAVDIALFAGGSHVDLAKVAQDPLYWAGRVLERVRQYELQVADVFLTPGSDLQSLAPTDADASSAARSRFIFEKVVEFAARLEAPGITMLPGVVPSGDTYVRAFDRAAMEISIRTEMARKCGLRLSVEPHYESLIALPEQTLDLVKAVPGLELTLDLAHFVYQGFGLEDIQPLIGYARHVQLRGARHNTMQARVKDDMSDLPGFVQMLRKAGYGGFIALEYVWMEKWDCDRVDNTSETLALLEMVRRHLQ